jgi:DNA-binding beta-propeller fold protein YncE
MTVEAGDLGRDEEEPGADLPEEEKKRKRRRLAVLGLLLLLLLLLALGGLWYRCNQWEEPRRFLAEQAGIITPHYLYSIYGMDKPLGVAVGADDRIWVTENGGERMVKVFDQEGTLLGEFSPPDTTTANRKPLYVALAPDGRVFVSDLLRQKVDIYDSEGTYLDFLRPDGQEDFDWSPAAMTFDEDGNLYVTDIGQHRILIIGTDENVIRVFGSEGIEMGRFAYPNGIALRDDLIYVADSNNARIQVLDQEGEIVSVIVVGKNDLPLGMPRGIGLTDDALYVVDAFEHAVQAFDPGSGGFKFAFGTPGIADGEFAYPNGLVIDGLHFYVTDRENGRIQIWTY